MVLHKPESVIENSECKILWVFPIQADKGLEYRKDGIAVIDKKKKQCWIIGFAVSRDQNVKSKSRRKFYNPRIWN